MNDIEKLRRQLEHAWVLWLESKIGQTMQVSFEGKRRVAGELIKSKAGFELAGWCIIPARLSYFHEISNTLISY